jgi:Rad3-related DNA helicase
MDAYAEIVEIGKAAAKAAGKDNWKPKWKSKPPPPPKPEPDIDVLETFEEATQQLYDRIMEMAQQEPLTPMLYRTTPGIGKTLSALHLASTMAMKEKQVFYGAPTRNMAWQMYDRIMLAESGNQKVIMLEGRHNGYVRRSIDEYGQVNEDIIDPNCHRYEKVEKAREKGYPSQHYVCASCPYWPHFVDKEGEKTGYMGACNYFKRVYEAAGIIKVKSVWTPIVVTTHHMRCLRCARPSSGTRERFSVTSKATSS